MVSLIRAYLLAITAYSIVLDDYKAAGNWNGKGLRVFKLEDSYCDNMKALSVAKDFKSIVNLFQSNVAFL